jgi:phosphatidylserine decarboxylase
MLIAREGYPYIVVLGIVTILFFAIGWKWIASIFLILTLFVMFFFRDPERTFSGNPNQVVSPADGKVVSIRNQDGKETLSIFLSPLDVHVTRAPVGGKITKIEYKAGKFLPAFDEKASLENERNSITIENQNRSVQFVQIAGIVARRIVCWRREGEEVKVGDRIGMIKFGSRVDVFLPAGSIIEVRKGQRVRAGETVIGEMR